MHSILDAPADDWQKVVDANLRTTHLCTQAAARSMKARGRGGAIVNVASIEGLRPAPLHSHYNAAKGGVLMYTQSAALELGTYGIRVNAVSPGLIWRDGIEQAWPDGVARTDDLARLFRQSDVVSLHMPLTEETHGLVTTRHLAGMPPGGYLVNVSRGGLVDVDALLAALDSGHLAGAALDVLPQEPPPPDHPALRHPKLLLSPHAAFYSTESDEEMRRESIRNIIDWARSGRPNFVVVEPESVT